MASPLFGWLFRRPENPIDDKPALAPREVDDGAVVVAEGGSFGTYVDLDGTVRTEAELVTRYRDMSLQPECDAAIDEIVNESMALDEPEIVRIILDDVEAPESVKKAIRDEFSKCLNILEFNRFAYEIYRKWYIDGRLYYHVIIDEKNPALGVLEVRYIDPRKIRKVREVQKKRAQGVAPIEAVLTKTVNEYYIYNDRGFNISGRGNPLTATNGIKIAKDSILHVTSGLTDSAGSMVLSYLHKAIKPLNQLRTLEDAVVIYRLARAPERRVWYIDTGNLPRVKSEQYVRDIMNKHKNRLVYDADSGNVRDDRKFMTMLEDYWLPRREGGRGTEVEQLAGGQNLGEMEDVLYFQKKLYQTLNVPVNRLNSDAIFSIGRATEISRDEMKFSKFITRLRTKFAMLFIKILEKQLVLKQIMSIDDWQNIQSDIKFDFAKDTFVTELKNGEIMMNRLQLAQQVQELADKYYSHEFIRKNILMQSDDDIEEQDKLIAMEVQSGDPRWINPMIAQNAMMEAQAEMAMAGPDEQDPEQQQQGGPPGGDQQDPEQQGDDTRGKPRMDKPGGGKSDSANTKMRKAQATYDRLAQVKNRSLKDEADFRSAAEILGKNK